MRMTLTAIAFCCLASGALAQQVADSIAPEAAGGGAFETMSPDVTAAFAAKDSGKPVTAENWMVAAANPHAVQAGADVLANGGTAADALVAVQAMLGLVEPQSSGLGGGAFLVWYDAASGEITTLDGRETAPLAVTPQLFQDASGEPLKFFDAVVGGRSVGTPGTPALLKAVHQRWGKLEWANLLAPAAAMAETGFTVSPRLASLVMSDAERLAISPSTAAYFLPDGVPIAAGVTLKNPDYARTLEILAEQGADAFYTGSIAADIAATVQEAAGNPGVLSQVDLSIYQVKERAAVCA
ncbi:MAG: gamma-glutamyltransferase, partial [Sulfitobacter sp.]|nr:gamma-glutamyltransferase [Sulfitobacter sp.]